MTDIQVKNEEAKQEPAKINEEEKKIDGPVTDAPYAASEKDES